MLEKNYLYPWTSGLVTNEVLPQFNLISSSTDITHIKLQFHYLFIVMNFYSHQRFNARDFPVDKLKFSIQKRLGNLARHSHVDN